MLLKRLYSTLLPLAVVLAMYGVITQLHLLSTNSSPHKKIQTFKGEDYYRLLEKVRTLLAERELYLGRPEMHQKKERTVAKKLTNADAASQEKGKLVLPLKPTLQQTTQRATTPNHATTSISTTTSTKKTTPLEVKIRRTFYKNASPEILKAFDQTLSGQERHLLFKLMKVFQTHAQMNNITYFVCGGSLLGSFRHHDLIPWDDDIDVYVDVNHYLDIITIFKRLEPKYKLSHKGPRYKLYSATSKYSSRTIFEWMYPYIDINFYQGNDTHVWDVAPINKDEYVFTKSSIFPLHLRPLGPLMVHAPRDSYANLLGTYNDLLCHRAHYSHKSENDYNTYMANRLNPREAITIPCELLKNKYAFVHRTPSLSGQGVNETLMLLDRVIHRVVVEEPNYAITNPYSLELVKN